MHKILVTGKSWGDSIHIECTQWPSSFAQYTFILMSFVTIGGPLSRVFGVWRVWESQIINPEPDVFLPTQLSYPNAIMNSPWMLVLQYVFFIYNISRTSSAPRLKGSISIAFIYTVRNWRCSFMLARVHSIGISLAQNIFSAVIFHGDISRPCVTSLARIFTWVMCVGVTCC